MIPLELPLVDIREEMKMNSQKKKECLLLQVWWFKFFESQKECMESFVQLNNKSCDEYSQEIFQLWGTGQRAMSRSGETRVKKARQLVPKLFEIYPNHGPLDSKQIVYVYGQGIDTRLFRIRFGDLPPIALQVVIGFIFFVVLSQNLTDHCSFRRKTTKSTVNFRQW